MVVERVAVCDTKGKPFAPLKEASVVDAAMQLRTIASAINAADAHSAMHFTAARRERMLAFRPINATPMRCAVPNAGNGTPGGRRIRHSVTLDYI